jgi:PEP-CTERM motif
MSTRNRLLCLTVAWSICCCLSTRLFAQGPGAVLPGTPGYTFAFDEHGNSLLNGGPNPFLVQPIANGGINYYLPFPVVQGYVLVSNSADVSTANTTGDSDLMFFFNTTLGGQTVGVMNFSSLIDDNDPQTDLADVTTLNFIQPVVHIGELGGEGFNVFKWTPDPANNFGAVYNGVSDGTLVPEPATLVLSGLGVLPLAMLAWRRRRRGRASIQTALFGPAVIALLLVNQSRTALAQAPGPGATLPGVVGFTLTFDEQGNSLLNGGANPNPVTFIAGGGVLFQLPGAVVPGDVLVFNPQDSFAGGHSDRITFSNVVNAAGRTDFMLYESLIDESTGADDPADVPSFPLTSTFVVQEFGPEGNNGFVWPPDPNNAAGAVYNGISDGLVPEPASIVLGGLGMLPLVGLAWRQRRRALARAVLR